MYKVMFYISITTCFFYSCEQTPHLSIISSSDRLWTGIAISNNDRLFVNYPRWSPGENISVAEINTDKKISAYPDQHWNSWNPDSSAKDRFVCIQSVYIDKKNTLWILDTGLDVRKGVVTGGAKLVKVNIIRNKISKIYYFEDHIIPAGTYLNDIRVDTEREFAYISDSGLGAIIVLNLRTGHARRILENHPSVQSENIAMRIEGKEWLGPDGKSPQIHCDGIALEPDGENLYYKALSGRTLYRINTALLRNNTTPEIELRNSVIKVGIVGTSDGLIFDSKNNLYISAIEENAIKKYSSAGKLSVIVQDSLLKWPDSFAISTTDELYITTSQIHLGANRIQPYYILILLP